MAPGPRSAYGLVALGKSAVCCPQQLGSRRGSSPQEDVRLEYLAQMLLKLALSREEVSLTLRSQPLGMCLVITHLELKATLALMISVQPTGRIPSPWASPMQTEGHHLAPK